MRRLGRVKMLNRIGGGWVGAAALACAWGWASATAGAAEAERAGRDAFPMSLREVAALPIPGVEVVSFDGRTGRIWAACQAGVVFADRDGEAGWRVTNAYQPADGSITHVQVDPAGRGFVLASVSPGERTQRGRVAVLDARDGALVAEWPAGYGPDCVVISQDGRFALVADEGEPVQRRDGTVFDPPGSVTRIDLRGVESLDAARNLPVDRVQPTLFARSWVQQQLDASSNGGASVRIHPENALTPDLDLEPEYIAFSGNRAWVTLQENNALALYDLEAAAWEALVPIPSVVNTIDASDRDGGIQITSAVRCLPMPDQLVVLGEADDPLIFFPGEGDTRAELGEAGLLPDHARYRALVRAGRALANPALDRLKVCSFSGDTTGDGVLDTPHAMGSRAVHGYQPSTGRWMDTGSLIERTISEHHPELFNANAAGSADTRSDDRGPEPEGIVAGKLDGRAVLFVSIERPGAVMAFDTELNLLAYDMAAARGHTGPEGLAFVAAERSPTGAAMLIVAFEVSGTLVVYEPVFAVGTDASTGPDRPQIGHCVACPGRVIAGAA